MSLDSSVEQLASLYNQGRYHDIVTLSEDNGISADIDPLCANILAASLFQLGEFTKALIILDQLETIAGEDINYLSLYGATCRRLGHMQKAESLLRKALEISNGSPLVYNNYANLLVDLKRFDEAEEILVNILSTQSDYQDAQNNLNRLRFIRDSHNKSVESLQSHKSNSACDVQPLQDPMTLAFSDEEISIAGFSKKNITHDGVASKLPYPDGTDLSYEQILLAYKSIQENNPEFALILCDQAHASLGANANICNCVADAKIKQEKFLEAEVSLLHSISIESPNVNQLINLVALSSIRGDTSLASFYLEKAASLDPSHPQLSVVRTNLDQRISNDKSAKFSYSSFL